MTTSGIKRLVFMGTPDFAVPALQALASRYEIVGVYTQPDRPVGRGLQIAESAVKKKAKELGLSVFQPQRLSLPEEFEKLAALKSDAIVVAAYGQILKKNVLELPEYGCINIHSSLLPRWRGAAPIHWALLSGDHNTGVTTMLMDQGLDTGDVLLQKSTEITALETAQTLHDRLSQMGAALIVETLSGLEIQALKRAPQDAAQATHAPKLIKEMGLLTPQAQKAEELARRIRTLNPWPGTWVAVPVLGTLKVLEAQLRGDLSGPQPPQIYEKNGMILLSTVQGSLELRRLQWQGGKPLGPMDFLNGLKGRGQTLPLQIGSGSV